MNRQQAAVRKPEWLKTGRLGSRRTGEILRRLRRYRLHTVCENAHCPNMGECFERGTATFMALGERCTRSCAFCAVGGGTSPMLPPDPAEPRHIAEMAEELGLRHVVVTMVTRDDLPDGGAAHMAAVTRAIRERCNAEVTVELLISDLGHDGDALDIVLDARPDVLNHNLETVRRLYPEVRPDADYEGSLGLLKRSAGRVPVTKSGFMVGLGETGDEVLRLMQDLFDAGVRIVTIGQYMPPAPGHRTLSEYIHPDVFEKYRHQGEELGFDMVVSGPLVRSSYHADRVREVFAARLGKEHAEKEVTTEG